MATVDVSRVKMEIGTGMLGVSKDSDTSLSDGEQF